MPDVLTHGLSTPTTNSPITTYSIDRDRRELDVSKVIAELFPDESPFLVLLLKAKKEPARSQYFYWYDQKPGNWWTQVKGSVTADQTVISVTDATIFRAKDLIKVPSTGEVMFVVAIDETEGANKVTVKRGYGETPASAIDADSWLMRIGNAMEQFSKAPESKIVQPFKGWNVTQIFRTTFEQSETAAAEDLKTIESERKRLSRLKLKEHRWDIERALIFGERYEDPEGKRSTTGGFLSFVKDHVVDANHKFCEGLFDEYCEELFSYGSKTKLFVCSRRVLTLINKFAKDRIETTSGETTYGLRLKTYVSAHGDLYLAPSMILEKEYGNIAIGIDMDNVKYRFFRDTKLVRNIQDNDEDGWRDEYITEAGLEVRLPQTHCVLINADTSGLTA